jgi:hypothetical protein
MSSNAAWELVHALTDAAKRHESWLRGHERGNYESHIDTLMNAEFAIVAKLTGIPINLVPFPEALDTSDLPANLIPIPSDDEREAERQAAFGRAVANFELPDDTEELAKHVNADVANWELPDGTIEPAEYVTTDAA